MGIAPLVHGEVYNGLTYRNLALLEPCALTVRLTAEPHQQQQQQQQEAQEEEEQEEEEEAESSGKPAQQPVQLVSPPEASGHAEQQQHAQQQPHGQQQQAQSPYARFPALAAALGQLLSVTVWVTNHGIASGSGGGSAGGSSGGDGGAGAGGDASGGGSGTAAGPLELQLDAALACLPVRGSEQEEAAAGGAGVAPATHGDLTAVWSGQLWSSLRLTVPAGQTVSRRLGLCLLAPGLYQLSLQHWRCRPAGERAAAAAQQQQQQQQQHKKKAAPAPPPGPLLNTMVAVHPCFVLAQ